MLCDFSILLGQSYVFIWLSGQEHKEFQCVLIYFHYNLFSVAKSCVSEEKKMHCVFCAGWFAQGAVVFKIYHVLKCLKAYVVYQKNPQKN